MAPLTTAFDWFDGMASDGGLRAAVKGRDARARYAEVDEFDDSSFISADWAALAGDWSSLGGDAQLADAAGPDGLIDDDVAFVAPWGFELRDISVPVLLTQGGLDRVVPAAHADHLLRNCRNSELWLRPNAGHISILETCPVAMDWLLALEHHLPQGGVAC